MSKRERNDEEVVGSAKKREPPKVLLAKAYEQGTHNPVGMWCSEKLDGVRAWWDGTNFWSRQGNLFYAPNWFKALFPNNIVLDGELYLGRNMFQETVSIVRTQSMSTEENQRWEKMAFHIFDIPSHADLPFEDRLHLMQTTLPIGTHLQVVAQQLLTAQDDLNQLLEEINAKGGEGLMLREAGSKYVHSRSSTLLKVKSFADDEAKIVGYVSGKGRLAEIVGSLSVEGRDGTKFKVGSGLSDEQRRNPPEIGTIITYRYQEKTKDGKPRFPTFVGIAIDKSFP